MQLLILQFSATSCRFFLLQTKNSPQVILSDTYSLYFPRNIRGSVLHPYKTADKIVPLYFDIYPRLGNEH
jgi:hypothetical protein